MHGRKMNSFHDGSLPFSMVCLVYPGDGTAGGGEAGTPENLCLVSTGLYLCASFLF
jgi:hypothetical protein